MQQRPEFHQVVLERCTSQKESALCVEVDQCLPSLALKVLDILCFVKAEVVPTLSFESERILHGQLIRRNHYMVPIRFGPTGSQLFAAFG